MWLQTFLAFTWCRSTQCTQITVTIITDVVNPLIRIFGMLLIEEADVFISGHFDQLTLNLAIWTVLFDQETAVLFILKSSLTTPSSGSSLRCVNFRYLRLFLCRLKIIFSIQHQVLLSLEDFISSDLWKTLISDLLTILDVWYHSFYLESPYILFLNVFETFHHSISLVLNCRRGVPYFAQHTDTWILEASKCTF